MSHVYTVQPLSHAGADLFLNTSTCMISMIAAQLVVGSMLITMLEVQRRLVGLYDLALASGVVAALVCRILARKVLPHPALQGVETVIWYVLACKAPACKLPALSDAATPPLHAPNTQAPSAADRICHRAHHFTSVGPLSSWPRVRPWRRAKGAARSACGCWRQRLHRS